MTVLSWQRGGTRGGPAIVCIHAWSHDGPGDFAKTGWVDALGGAGLDVLVCDLPGHGDSADVVIPTTAEPAAWSASAIEADLVKLGVRHYTAAGYAQGGLVAGNLAVRQPETVQRLVLISVDDRTGIPHAAEVARALRGVGRQFFDSEAGDVVARARADRRHYLPTLADWAERATWPAAARLGALRTPTLLGVGTDSAQRERLPRLAKLFHDARIVTAAGDEHSVLGAAELLQAVASFVPR